MDQALSVAVESARAGARVLAERAGDVGLTATKSSSVDFVTEADIAAGVAIVETIREAMPEARFVVEEPEVMAETGASPGALDQGDTWVIDPLDGTTSYVHGYPFYSVSVALLREGEREVGAVLNVPSEELFTAVRGQGTELDGVPISCSTASALEEALLVTGFPYDRGETLTRQLGAFSEFMKVVHGVRRDGSAALDLCHVAAGRADGFWEFGLSPWDTAAGSLIAQEAGAVVTDFERAPWSPATRNVIAAGAALHPLMVDVLDGR